MSGACPLAKASRSFLDLFEESTGGALPSDAGPLDNLALAVHVQGERNINIEKRTGQGRGATRPRYRRDVRPAGHDRSRGIGGWCP